MLLLLVIVIPFSLSQDTLYDLQIIQCTNPDPDCEADNYEQVEQFQSFYYLFNCTQWKRNCFREGNRLCEIRNGNCMCKATESMASVKCPVGCYIYNQSKYQTQCFCPNLGIECRHPKGANCGYKEDGMCYCQANCVRN